MSQWPIARKLAVRAKVLMLGMLSRTGRYPDIADFEAAFNDEIDNEQIRMKKELEDINELPGPTSPTSDTQKKDENWQQP